MTKEYRDLVELQTAIEAGEEPPLPPLDCENGDPYFQSLNYYIDLYGPKGKRKITTGPDKNVMVQRNTYLLVNSAYKEFYSC